MNKHSANSSAPRRIVVVGAGPSGSGLAIRLAAAGHRVTLLEKERFPREKLCGEFVSPECFAHFADLGVEADILSRGGARISETRFFDAVGRSVAVSSHWFGCGDFALSLSRAEMDEALLSRAKALGVEAVEQARVVGIESSGTRVIALRTNMNGNPVSVSGDLFVDATGRAGAISRLVEKQHGAVGRKKPRLLALKNHVTGVTGEKNACEMYFFGGGYCGLSPVEGGKWNLCLIAEVDRVKDLMHASHRLAGLMRRNARASFTLRNAEPTGDWLAVPIDDFGRRNPQRASNLISVGDAAAFIDPFTGSGMLMALEGAELLAEMVKEHGLDPSLPDLYSKAHGRRFRRRLAASSVLRRLAFLPRLTTTAIFAAGLSEALRERLARSTRAGAFPSR